MRPTSRSPAAARLPSALGAATGEASEPLEGLRLELDRHRSSRRRPPSPTASGSRSTTAPAPSASSPGRMRSAARDRAGRRRGRSRARSASGTARAPARPATASTPRSPASSSSRRAVADAEPEPDAVARPPRPTPTPAPSATASPSPGIHPDARRHPPPAPTPDARRRRPARRRSRSPPPGPCPSSSRCSRRGVVVAEAGRLGTPRVLAIADATGGIAVRLPDGVALPARGRCSRSAARWPTRTASSSCGRAATGITVVGTAALPAPMSITAGQAGRVDRGPPRDGPRHDRRLAGQGDERRHHVHDRRVGRRDAAPAGGRERQPRRLRPAQGRHRDVHGDRGPACHRARASSTATGCGSGIGPTSRGLASPGRLVRDTQAVRVGGQRHRVGRVDRDRQGPRRQE